MKYKTKGGAYEHRLAVEEVLGRKLAGTERVHHVDRNKANNCNSNLVVCPDEKYHKLLHARQRIIDLGGHPDTHSYCSYHCALHETSQFSTRTGTWNGLHNTCRNATNEYRKAKGLNRDKFNWMARLNQQYRRAKKLYTSSPLSWISPWEESQ